MSYRNYFYICAPTYLSSCVPTMALNWLLLFIWLNRSTLLSGYELLIGTEIDSRKQQENHGAILQLLWLIFILLLLLAKLLIFILISAVDATFRLLCMLFSIEYRLFFACFTLISSQFIDVDKIINVCTY